MPYLFDDNYIHWAAIFELPRLVTCNACMRSFEDKILMPYYKKLHIFRIYPSSLCSFCNLCDRTPLRTFTPRLSFLLFLILQVITPL